MAQTKNGSSGASKPTVAELRSWYDKNQKRLGNYELAENQVKRLRDVTKNASGKSISAFNKDTVITYLQSPGNNEKNLRNLSRYLYYRSNIYFRICEFFSNMPMLNARQVVPKIDLSKGMDQKKALKSYNQTLELIDRMNLVRNFKKVFSTVFREDVFYGLYWIDDTGMIIIPWDPDYAKISGITSYGTYTFAIDVSWFRSRQDILEFWGEPYTTLYQNYLNGESKWQDVGENGVCIKFRDDWELVVPVFSGLFLDLINLLDLSDVQAVMDQQAVYRMVYQKLATLKGSSESDDFAVSPDLAIKYFDIFKDALPDYTAAAVVPGTEDLGVINFSDQDAASDTTRVSKATTQVLTTAGGSEVLDGAHVTSAAAFKAAMIANTRFALTSILPQVEGWVAMVLDQQITNPSKVHFFMVSPYTQDDFRDNLLTGAQNGLPNAMAYNSFNEMSEMDTMAMLQMQEILGIPDNLKPLQTSYTQSGSDGEVGQGRDMVPDDELSDSGERSRNA